MKDREELNIEFLASQIAEGFDIDECVVRKELLALSSALSIPVGLLRSEDVVEELIGEDYFSGDAVLEIEKKLQFLPRCELHKLTVRKVIVALSLEDSRRASET